MTDPSSGSRWQIVIPREKKGDKELWADPEVLLGKFKSKKAEYKCYAEHVSDAETPFKHYHCYIRFAKSYPRDHLVRTFGQNIRFMNGDDFANAEYIAETKRMPGGNPTFCEEGIKKRKEDQNAGVHVRKLLEDGVPLFEIIGEYPEYHAFINQNKWVLGEYAQYHSRKRSRDAYEAPEELYEWQQHALRRIESKPHPRHIHWYMDTEGDIGKTEMVKYLVSKHEAMQWQPTGDSTKAAEKFISNSKGRMPKTVVCNIPNTDAKNINWVMLENAKDGFVQSERYNCPFVEGPPPHILVFTNDSDANSTMTKNRIVKHIIKNKKVIESYIDNKQWQSEEGTSSPGNAVEPSGSSNGEAEDNQDDQQESP